MEKNRLNEAKENKDSLPLVKFYDYGKD